MYVHSRPITRMGGGGGGRSQHSLKWTFPRCQFNRQAKTKQQKTTFLSFQLGVGGGGGRVTGLPFKKQKF